MISKAEADTVDYLKIFYVLTVAILVLSIPMLAVGDLLPTWIFVHSL
jgi:hypothetical protein